MIGALLTCVLALAPTAQDGPRTTTEAAARESRDVDALRTAWREAIELDVPGEVLAAGAWIETDARADAELTALYTRALHAAGLDERAAKLVARSEAPPLVLAAARMALDRDEVDRARSLLVGKTPAPGRTAPEAPRFPEESAAWLLLGRAEARAGRLDRAEPLLAEFVKRAPWNVEAPEAWFVLVEAARARGDAREAELRERSRLQSAEWHAFYRARRLQVRANPREPLPRLGLAQLWLAAGDLARARAANDAALAIDARFCRGIELAAEIDRRAGALEQARARCAAALECEPTLADPHLTLARIARDGGDSAAADASYARYRSAGGTKEL
jgi:Tfp pilus assembly protein PilF